MAEHLMEFVAASLIIASSEIASYGFFRYFFTMYDVYCPTGQVLIDY
jgi:hypothetical protein